jgi:DNA recombination protein RmuC
MAVITALVILASLGAVVWFARRERALHDQLADVRLAARSGDQVLEGAELLAHWVIAEHAERLDARLAELERRRLAESTSLQQMVTELRDVTVASRDQTARLAGALTDSRVRGLWGETQLRRVVELAGMAPFCDFVEQRGVSSGERSGRPDVVVRLPNGRTIVVDAKVPLDRYLEAANCEDPARRQESIRQHAAAVRAHVTQLDRRRYADLVDGAVDVVVMFLPGDAFLNAAMDGDATLLESSWRDGVVLATPSSLFALLRAVSVGWQERQVADEAAEIAQLGRELHERIGTFCDHYAKVGKALGRAVDAYNGSIGSLESRLLATARKLDAHAAGSRATVPSPADLRIESVPRPSLRELNAG